MGKINKNNPVLIFLSLMLFAVVMWIDFFGVGVALPLIAQDFSVSIHAVHWLVTLYAIGYVGFIVTATRLADKFGRKQLFLNLIILFLIASILVGFGTKFWVILLGRVLQGVAAGSLVVMIISFISYMYEGEKRKYWIGWFMGMSGVGMATGPILCGILVNFFSWRSLFYINIPIAIFVFVISYLGLPNDVKSVKKIALDIPGMVLICIAISSFALVLSQGEDWGILSHKSIIIHIIWIVALLAFCWVESIQKDPLIHGRFFKYPNFIMANLIGICIYFGLTSWLVLSSLYYSNILKFTPMEVGFTFIPFGVACFVMNLFLPKLNKSLPIKIIIILGLLIEAISFAWLSCSVFFNWNILLIGIGSMGLGASFTIVNTLTVPLAIAFFKLDEINIGSGMTQMFRWIGSALGAPVMSYVFIKNSQLLGKTHGLMVSYIVLSIIFLVIVIASVFFLRVKES